MTMSVNLIEGNILTPPTRNENTIICHQVNCRELRIPLRHCKLEGA